MQEEFREAIGGAAEMTAREGGALDRARVSLGFLDELGDEVESLRQRVMAVRPNLPAVSAQGPHPAALDSRYTIASEREVHRRVTQSAAGPEPGETATAVATLENDNIDLFLDPPSVENAAAGEDLGDNIEFF